MRVVIDTNILMSALIKDSFTRKIILDSEIEFYYPEISLKELEKHEKMVLAKSGLNKTSYRKILKSLLENIILVPTEYFSESIDEANKILGHIDPDDVVFLAMALSYGIPIWSDDSDFKKQEKSEVLTTGEIARKIFKKR